MTLEQKPLRILVADDIDSYREGIAKRLMEVCQAEGLEASVTQVSDGDEVIKQVTENPSYDLVFTDNKMKRVLGSWAIMTLRKNGYQIPIYLISGSKIEKSELEKIGATGYIRKPLEFEVKDGSMGIGEMIQQDLEEFDSKLAGIIKAYQGGKKQ